MDYDRRKLGSIRRERWRQYSRSAMTGLLAGTSVNSAGTSDDYADRAAEIADAMTKVDMASFPGTEPGL